MTINERHQTPDEPTGRVKSLLAAAAAPTEPGPQPGESEALAAFRAAHPQERTRMLSRINPVRAALTTSAAALLLTGSFAAAAAGALPGAAQDTAHEMLAKIGVTVPGPNEASNGHPDGRGSSDDTDETTTAPESTDDPTASDDESHGKGAEVSELAKNPDLTGIEKGAAVSTLASGGKSQAGQHGSAADAQSGAPTEHGKPATAGKPEGAGQPDGAGRPDTAGKPDDAGRPDTAGKPEGAGPPAAPGDQSAD